MKKCAVTQMRSVGMSDEGRTINHSTMENEPTQQKDERRRVNRRPPAAHGESTSVFVTGDRRVTREETEGEYEETERTHCLKAFSEE